MNQICISYDLRNKNSSHYSKIYQQLRNYDSQRIQLSMWLLNTPKTAEEVITDFRHCVDMNDRFAAFSVNNDLLNILKE